jgi:histidinol-phosphate aminotransferase
MGLPSFMIYAILCQTHQAEAVQISHPDYRNDLPAFVDHITDRTKVIWVDNPNNPTGAYVPKDEVDRFVRDVDGRAIVVLDEAYQQFVDHPEIGDGTEYIKEGVDNVVVLRTFSKIVGLAGVRCGYGIMHPELARTLGTIRIKFSVNALAQAAALASLDDTEHVERARQMVAAGRTFFYGQLDAMGLRYNRTQGNFIWIEFGPHGREICNRLMALGAIVRPGWIFEAPEWARVSISTESDNAFFFEKLRIALQSR